MNQLTLCSQTYPSDMLYIMNLQSIAPTTYQLLITHTIRLCRKEQRYCNHSSFPSLFFSLLASIFSDLATVGLLWILDQFGWSFFNRRWMYQALHAWHYSHSPPFALGWLHRSNIIYCLGGSGGDKSFRWS